MTGLLRRLWAKRRRRTVTNEPEPRTDTAGPDAAERLEDARRRLKETIPSPQDDENPITSPQPKQTPPSPQGAENLPPE